MQDSEKRAAYDKECDRIKLKTNRGHAAHGAGHAKNKNRPKKYVKVTEVYSESHPRECRRPKDMNHGTERYQEPIIILRVERTPVHTSQPVLGPVDLIAYYRRRIRFLENEMDELDRLDMEDEEEIENAMHWDNTWDGRSLNWTVVHLEKQIRLREEQRREIMKESREIWGEVTNVVEQAELRNWWI